MSATGEGVTWFDEAVLVRVDTVETGWALHGEGVRRLLEMPWRLVAIDGAGLRGVLVDTVAVDTIAKVTRELGELNTTQVRDDVAVALIEAGSPSERGQVAARVGAALAEMGARPLGLFVENAVIGVAFERWRRPALQALTSVSGS